MFLSSDFLSSNIESYGLVFQLRRGKYCCEFSCLNPEYLWGKKIPLTVFEGRN